MFYFRLESCNIKRSVSKLWRILKKLSVIYKRNPSEVNMVPYSTVILLLLLANINIQDVTGMCTLLIYLTPYLCKPEYTMSELIKKTARDTTGKEIIKKLQANGKHYTWDSEILGWCPAGLVLPHG